MKKTILLLVACSFSFLSIAQVNCKLKKNPELKKELRTYYEQNTYPVLKKAHSNFDNSLPSTDLAALQNLRTANKQLMADKKEIYKEIKAQVKAGKSKEEAKAAYESQFQEMRTANMDIRKKLRPIIENNSELIKSALEGLKPDREKWGADRETIVAKYYSAEELEACRKKWQEKTAQRKGAKPQGPAKGMQPRNPAGKRPEGNRMDKMQLGKRAHIAKFLLWNGEMKEEFSFEGKQNDVGKSNQAEMGLAQNYPNPASGTTTVKVKLPQDTDFIKVTITDQAGRTVREFDYDSHKKGEHGLLLEIQGLATGNYFYTVQAKGFKETKQMSVR